jgi:hypothetical protein
MERRLELLTMWEKRVRRGKDTKEEDDATENAMTKGPLL